MMVKKRDDRGGAHKAAPNRRPLAGQSLLQIHLLSKRYSRRAGLCTKIPLDTPLVRLVTADPAIVVIEHDIPQGMNGLVVRSKTYKSRLVRSGWQGSAF
jgi:hypothetical protein